MSAPDDLALASAPPLRTRQVVGLTAVGLAGAAACSLCLRASGETRLAVVALLVALLFSAVTSLSALYVAGRAVATGVHRGLERRGLLRARIRDRQAGSLSVAPPARGALSEAEAPRA